MEMESQSERFLDYDVMAFEATAPLVGNIIHPQNKLTLHYKPSKKRYFFFKILFVDKNKSR